MPIKIDVKDKKILYELDTNARQAASQIARSVGLSPDGVNYRIKRLIKNDIIFKFMTLFDTAKLGLTTYKVLYRFQNTTPAKEREIIDFLVAHKNTQLVSSTEGMFDLNINFLASNVEDLDVILNSFNKNYGSFIAERIIHVMVRSHFFFRDYLIKRQSSDIRKPMFFGSKPLPAKADATDMRIITLLAQDARIPVIKLARIISLSPDSIIKRMRKLEKSGIIQNYILFPNYTHFGYTWYYLLLKLSDFTPEMEKRFFSYCQLHPNIWCYNKLIGHWDCAINIDVASDDEFRGILSTIKRDFSRIVKEYDIIKIVRVYKFNQYPMGNSK